LYGYVDKPFNPTKKLYSLYNSSEMANIRVGSVIRYEDREYIVLDYKHSHRGSGGATISLKFKDLHTGSVQTFTLRDTDEIEDVMVEKKPAIFSYKDGSYYHLIT